MTIDRQNVDMMLSLLLSRHHNDMQRPPDLPQQDEGKKKRNRKLEYVKREVEMGRKKCLEQDTA